MPTHAPLSDADLQHSLDSLGKNFKAEMARVPEKRDRKGQVVTAPQTPFSPGDVASADFVEKRDSVRKTLHTEVNGAFLAVEDAIPGKAPIEAIDRPENLADVIKYTDLRSIESAGLLKAQLPVQPWSDDYWGLFLGCLGKRYGDPEFPGSQDWKENWQYVKDNGAAGIVSDGDADVIDLLSPAEKYDLLIGDPSGSLTRAMWAQGQGYYDRNGSVETWMGICHGWSPAAFMVARPTKPISVLAADGKTRLTFYPADLKALASLLWATTNPSTRFIGGRCNEKDPPTDENGRVTSSAAFDTNPGTWHLVATNQIGVARRGFIMDATFDYEVWNQPVAAYEYRYFNPQTLQLAGSLAEATVSKAAFTSDRFGRYRSANAASYTGVIMQVSYIREVAPQQLPSDSPDDDCVQTVIYKYDLEQDAAGRILGGEWYTGRCHPDFLWTPPPGTRALTPAESLATESWDGSGALPPTWRRAAQSAAGRGMPLAKLVDVLVHLASR